MRRKAGPFWGKMRGGDVSVKHRGWLVLPLLFLATGASAGGGKRFTWNPPAEERTLMVKFVVHFHGCTSCGQKIADALKKVKGVLDARSVPRQDAAIAFFHPGKADIGEMKRAVQLAGFQAQLSHAPVPMRLDGTSEQIPAHEMPIHRLTLVERRNHEKRSLAHEEELKKVVAKALAEDDARRAAAAAAPEKLAGASGQAAPKTAATLDRENFVVDPRSPKDLPTLAEDGEPVPEALPGGFQDLGKRADSGQGMAQAAQQAASKAAARPAPAKPATAFPTDKKLATAAPAFQPERQPAAANRSTMVPFSAMPLSSRLPPPDLPRVIAPKAYAPVYEEGYDPGYIGEEEFVPTAEPPPM